MREKFISTSQQNGNKFNDSNLANEKGSVNHQALSKDEDLRCERLQAEIVRLKKLLNLYLKADSDLDELRHSHLELQNEYKGIQKLYLKLEDDLLTRQEILSEPKFIYQGTSNDFTNSNSKSNDILKIKFRGSALNFVRNGKSKISSWLLKKKARLEHLTFSARYIWERYGILPLLSQFISFLGGERKNGKFDNFGELDYSKVDDLVFKDLFDGISYDQWIQETEPNQEQLDLQKLQELEFSFRPLISILTPVYNTDLKMLKGMIESVLSQTYSNWELCLVDGSSTKLHIRPILESYQKIDRRIKVKFLDQNLGISGNSNCGISMINGEFTALLDHDDLLSPNALFEVVKLLNGNKNLDFIYTDKDTISSDGLQRYNPLFKPDWSPEVLFNANYLTHLNVIRTKILRKIEGGFDKETDGAQDWDLFLRVTSISSQIAHLPKILYHWRSHSESTALCIEAKPYAVKGQLRCIQKFIAEKGINAKVNFNKKNMPQIEWQSEFNSSVSIIIDLNKNVGNLSSIINDHKLRLLFPNIEFIVLNRLNKNLAVDINDKVKILNFDQNVPLGKVFQSAVDIATNQMLVFLDADLKPHINSLSSAIHEMVNWAQIEEIGIVGAMLLYPNQKIASTGLILGKDFHARAFGEGLNTLDGSLLGHFIWYRNFSAIPRHCFALKKSLIEKIGGLDVNQNATFHIDLGLKLLDLKLRHFYTPNAMLRFETTKKLDWQIPAEEFLTLSKMHNEFFENIDPYFNSNLAFANEKIVFQKRNLQK